MLAADVHKVDVVTAVVELVSAAANSGRDEKKGLAQSDGGLHARATAAVRQANPPAGSHGSLHGKKKAERDIRDRMVWGLVGWFCLSGKWAMPGRGRIERDIRACPRLSVATQKLPRFGSALGRSGQYGDGRLGTDAPVGS